MRNIRYATSLFFLGWLVGAVLGSIGYTIPAFLSWRFSLLDINAATFKIIINNLVAAFITALGPFLAAKILKIGRSDAEGVTLLHMIPTLILFLNGFSAGYFTGALVGELAPALILLSIAPHGVLEIPAIIMSGAVGFANIEGLGSSKLAGKKYLPIILLLILAGGYVEGNVTGELPQIRTPIKIIDLDAPAQAEAGVNFRVNITVENSGIIRPGYYLALYGTSAERVYEEASFPVGRSTVEKEMAVYAPGTNNITAAIIKDTGVVSSDTLIIEAIKPRISIGDVEVQNLYAGEDAVINVNIENGDEVERSVDFVFQSSTGATSVTTITLKPKEKLVHPYPTLIGQPGPRRFEIALIWEGLSLSQKTVDAEVLGLRIKPVITSVDIPKLRVNLTSTIAVEVENKGAVGGNVSLLIFDSTMPQLFKQGDTLGVILNRKHLGKGLLAEKDLYLETNGRQTVKVEITPREIGSSKLLVFALRREVISDATSLVVEVAP